MSAALDSGIVLGLEPGSLLGAFNGAGILAPADVHVARRLASLGGERDESVALAAAFAVRAPRVGHVRVDLGSVRETAESDTDEELDLDALPWPEAERWAERLAGSPLVAKGEDGTLAAPLRLVGRALYLDRYWRDERAVAADLLARVSAAPGGPEPRLLPEGLARLFPEADAGEQRWAAATAALSRLAVIAGGPGTGKTTTVARLIALLLEQADATGSKRPLVALAAPTGKAANRLQEAVHAAAGDLAVGAAVHGALLELEAATVHRLLRPRRGSASRFRHDRHNPLPHDVVVVDETSMLSLWLMARLAEAVRGDARLVLVGDPEQLASVEAGAVLGDVVGPASSGLRMRESTARRLERLTGSPQSAAVLPEKGPAVGDGVVLLRANHRFRGSLAGLADAVRSGEADRVIDVLRTGVPHVEWVAVDAGAAEPGELEPVRRLCAESGAAVLAAARAGDGEEALRALGTWRILCAHRRGPAGVSVWNPRVERWLADDVAGFAAGSEWYLGRPVVVTANDYGLRLFNGDAGVVVAGEAAGVRVAFERGPVSPSRLFDVDTVYAMTVHKAQGSEFDRVGVVLPEPSSRVLTRELLYTAVTRARESVVLVGTEQSVRSAVEHPIARASGLTERLWGTPAGEPLPAR